MTRLVEYGALVTLGLVGGIMLAGADIRSLAFWTAAMAAATFALAAASAYQAVQTQRQAQSTNQQLDLQRKTLELQGAILRDQMRPMLVWAKHVVECLAPSPRSTFWVVNKGRSTATVVSAGFLSKKGQWQERPVDRIVPPESTVQVVDAPHNQSGIVKVTYRGPLGDEYELVSDYDSVVSDLASRQGQPG